MIIDVDIVVNLLFLLLSYYVPGTDIWNISYLYLYYQHLLPVLRNYGHTTLQSESNSPSGQTFLVKGRSNEWWLCGYCSWFNSWIIKNRYTIPSVDEHIRYSKDWKYITTLDLATEYHQNILIRHFIPRTAAISLNGQWEWRWTAFQKDGNYRLMKQLAYMDDILIPSVDLQFSNRDMYVLEPLTGSICSLVYGNILSSK